MAKKTKTHISPCCRRYGPPLYCASWIPLREILSNQQKIEFKEENESFENLSEQEIYLAIGGGGGEGRSGVPNAIIVTKYDFASGSLSEEPIYRLETEGDVPYRMAVHPTGKGIICSFPKGCRWFEWDVPQSMENFKLGVKFSQNVLAQLENVGLQLALTFNKDGSILAAGGEDGHLRVFKWQSMETVLDNSDAHTSIKDLDFSLDGKFLVSLGSSGPCRVWDLSSSSVIASLPRENGEILGFCRFAQNVDNIQTLYLTAMKDQKVSIVSWSSSTWERVGSKKIVHDPISAFNVSSDGKFLAIGTIEGDIIVVNSASMQIHTTVKKAHIGLVTSLMFSQDTRVLVSASFDASVRVTKNEKTRQMGSGMWLILLFLLLSVLIYILKQKGFTLLP